MTKSKLSSRTCARSKSSSYFEKYPYFDIPQATACAFFGPLCSTKANKRRSPRKQQVMIYGCDHERLACPTPICFSQLAEPFGPGHHRRQRFLVYVAFPVGCVCPLCESIRRNSDLSGCAGLFVIGLVFVGLGALLRHRQIVKYAGPFPPIRIDLSRV